MGILDYFFDRKTDEQKFILSFAKDVYAAFTGQADALADVVQTESAKRGVDPAYVMHRLIFDSKGWWGKVRHQDQDALFQAVDLYSQVGSNKININRFEEPPAAMQPVVDTIFYAVGQWASGGWLQMLGSAYREALKAKIRDAQQLVKRKTGEDLSYQDTFYWIHGKLEEAVQKHLYGIPHRNFLGTVLELMAA